MFESRPLEAERTMQNLREVYGKHGTDPASYTPRTDLYERASKLIAEAYDRGICSFDTSFVQLAVVDNIRSSTFDYVSQPLGRALGFRGKDKNTYCHYLIVLSENAYEENGWDTYSHIVMHELAHVEVTARWIQRGGLADSAPSDGDRLFEQVCEEFHAYRSSSDMSGDDPEHVIERWW